MYECVSERVTNEYVKVKKLEREIETETNEEKNISKLKVKKNE